MKALLLSALALCTALTVFACGDDDDSGSTADKDAGSSADTGSTNPTPEAGTGTDAAVDTGTDASDGSTTPQAVNGCTDADFDAPAGANGGDFTGFPGADITFPMGAAPAQYTNHCVKVKVGSAVNFNGAFSSHPLMPSGGNTPTPLVATSTGTDASFTMASAGTFGFVCAFHPTIMFGAIRVVP